MKSYAIQTNSDDFFANVEYFGRKHARITLGGLTKRGCVIIELDKNRGEWEGVLNVSYDISCNTTNDLKRGHGTVAMLQAAIALAFYVFPSIVAIYLKDHSKVACGARDIYLPALEVATYGKTWYERVLGAVPDDPRVTKRLQRWFKLSNRDVIWNNLWKDVSIHVERKHRTKVFETMAHIWKGSLSATLTWVKNHRSYCDAFVPWLENYFHEIVAINLRDADFKVTKSENDSYSVSIKPLETNPYQQMLEERRTQMKKQMDILSNFVSPSQLGGRTVWQDLP